MMPSTPKSTKKGAAIAAFPDVCHTPSGPAPVPIPYPNTTASGGAASKAASTQVKVQLKSKLSTLHNQLSALEGSDPTRWHALLDEYVVTTAALYKVLAEGASVARVGTTRMHNMG